MEIAAENTAAISYLTTEIPQTAFWFDHLTGTPFSEMYRSCNGSVAGMTLMGPAVFAVEQIGVDSDGSVTEIQEEAFVGQREKMLAAALERRSHLLIQQATMMQFGELRRSHVLAHVQLGCQLVRTRWDKFLAVGMEVAELGQDGERLGLQSSTESERVISVGSSQRRKCGGI